MLNVSAKAQLFHIYITGTMLDLISNALSGAVSISSSGFMQQYIYNATICSRAVLTKIDLQL